MDKYLEQLGTYAMTVGLRLLATIALFVIGFKLANFFVKRIKNSNSFSKLDPSAAGFIASCISIGSKIIIIVTGIAIMGVPMSSVVALVASAGVAVGLAVQGALSNLVGGMMILLFKPFAVGDYVEAQSVSGTVKEISVFYTVLCTPDNKIITLPNGNLTNSVVVNYSSEEFRRVDIECTADYAIDTDIVKSTLLDVASSCQKVMNAPAPVSVVTDYGDHGINYCLRVWCKNEHYWDVKSELLDCVRAAFKKQNIKIPYQQLEVKILNDN